MITSYQLCGLARLSMYLHPDSIFEKWELKDLPHENKASLSYMSCRMGPTLPILIRRGQSKYPAVPPYFEFLGLSSYFQQLSNRVHKALVVEVAHFLDFSVMVANTSFQLLHESSMFLTIIDRPLKRRWHNDYSTSEEKRITNSEETSIETRQSEYINYQLNPYCPHITRVMVLLCFVLGKSKKVAF